MEQMYFFCEKMEYWGFQLSNEDTVPIDRKVGSIVKIKKFENSTDVRLMIASIT